MSEPVATPEEQQAPPEGADVKVYLDGEELTPEVLRKQLEKARKEAANYRTKVRELEPLASKAQQLEDAGRTELEKLTGRAEQAETRATTAESRALRLEVAFDKGLTPAQAKRLVGGTREELEADADEILRDFPVKTDGRPKGNADIGPRAPAPPLTDGSPRSLIAAGIAASDAAKH